MNFTQLSRALVFLTGVALANAQPLLTVQGAGGKTITLSAAELSALPAQTVTVAAHGSSATFLGVRVADVLAKVDLPVGEKFHHTAASYFVLVEAKDGYRAVFAWAEVDPSFMDKQIYLALKKDGKPLSEKDGPLQLVVPGEKRAARSVRQVTALRIEQAK